MILALVFLAFFQWTIGSRSFASGSPPPIVALPMNEGSGLTFNDTSGNADNATLNAAVTWQSNAGMPGTTPLFNGTQFAPTVSSSLVNFAATQPFTVAFCANVFVSSSGSTFASTLANNSAPFTGWEAATIGGAGGSLFEFYLINNFPTNAINVSTPRPDGSTKKIVITYNAFFNGTKFPASDVVVYYDGVAQTPTVGTDTLTGDPRSNQPLRIGGRPGGAQLSGAMSYFETWLYAQTAAQVAINAALPCGIH